jgi:type I restriction enzyme S subunit
MNKERLLAHYQRIADAPDAIARLRRFILDLAVRGKLVPQEVAWQSAKIEGCLEPLADGRFIHQGWSPQCESHPSPTSDVWAVLKTTAIQDGFFLEDQNKELPGKLEPKPMLEVRAGDILITCAGPRARCGIACLVRETREQLIISGKMYRFRANEKIVSREYLLLFLRSEEAQGAINLMKTGSSESGLNLTQDRFRTLEITFGALSEQRRIVAKVDELMSLCDRLEAARASREGVRDRLAAASLARLNEPNPETFQADARFALDALSALTMRPDQIKALRQTILNLAVRGKLVPQDPNEEPASELLKRIAKEIAAYSKANRVSQVQVAPITDDDLPFTAPNGWKWTRLCALFKVITDGDHQPPPRAEEGTAFLTIGNITTGKLDFSGCRLVPEAYFKALAPYRTPAKGDILYTVVGATYGRPAVVDTDRDFCVQRHIAILKPAEAMSLRYLVTLLASPLIYDQATRSTTGTAQPTIALRPLRNFLAPLPPLAEQHRIVAKVDALMALCDRLEGGLTTAAAARRRLLDALLAEALAPEDCGLGNLEKVEAVA